MFFVSKTFCKQLCATALVPLIVGCSAIAPGMHLDATEGGGASLGGATPPVTLITPELLRSVKARRDKAPTPDLGNLVSPPQEYRIGSGDLLSIVVWDHPELNLPTLAVQSTTGPAGAFNQAPAGSGYVVDRQGFVQFPGAGPIRLAGLTELQARNLLVEKLNKVIKQADLTLRVVSYRSQRIYLDGEVKLPGSQPIDDVPMTLLEALGRAGGALPSADESHITVTRDGVAHLVDLPLLVRKGFDPGQILLKSGDLVRVPPATENKIFVLGEVTAPKALTMNNGSLTLNDALGQVGGLNPLSSEGRQVYVIREDGQSQPAVFNLDARSPIALALAEGFQLHPKDVVYVAPTGLANFNRIISMILPSASTLNQAIK